jgi:hypothetical protein
MPSRVPSQASAAVGRAAASSSWPAGNVNACVAVRTITSAKAAHNFSRACAARATATDLMSRATSFRKAEH